MKLKPLSDRVVVKVASTESKSKSGIIIPDTASKEKPQEGVIVAVGPGRLDSTTNKRIAVELKKGDKVLFENWAGKDYKSNDIEYKILREEEILGTIEK